MEGNRTGNPIIFWGWNEELDFEIMRGQMERMKEQGVTSVMPHARMGIRTDYFGEKWFEIYDRVVEYAAKIGLKVWLYDEKGWPSGFGGGALLKDNPFPVTYLEEKESDKFDGNALACFILSGSGYEFAAKDRGTGKYRNIYKRANESYVDLLNPAATDAFIRHTYEGYYRRYREEINRTVVGIFTDEPQYYRWATPYTDMLEEEFEKRYGYDYKPHLIGLFEDCAGAEKFRYDYYGILSVLYTQNYIRRLYEWCDARGLVLSGHSVEEMNFSGQIACCGDVMPFYEYEHIPGIDWLGNICRTDLSAKQCSSVARQLGKEFAMVELDAVTGWSVGPRRLKQLYDFLAVDEIPIICQSIYEYTLRGEGKRDYPIDFSTMLPWSGKARVLNDYFKAAGEFLCSTKEKVRTLVFHPLRSGYLKFKKADAGAADEYLGPFVELVENLNAHRIAYHFGDETILKKYGSVNGKKFIVGACSYDYVVLPEAETISAEVLELLRKFSANGGKIFGKCVFSRIDGERAAVGLPAVADLKELNGSADYTFTNSDGKAVPDVKSTLREDAEGNRYLFAVNQSDTAKYEMKLCAAGVKGAVELDLVKGTESPCDIGALQFGEGASHVYRLSAQPIPKAAVREKVKQVLREWRLVPAENILVLDRARLEKDGGGFSREKDVAQIRKELYGERYCGQIRLRFEFDCAAAFPKMNLIAEKDAFDTLTVNGRECTAAPCEWRDAFFFSYEIGGLVRRGKNTVELTRKYFQREELYEILDDPSKMESVKNAVFYDSYIENIYLSGEFGVKNLGKREEAGEKFYRLSGGFALVPERRRVYTGSLAGQGFPFFSGELRLQREIVCGAGETLSLRMVSDVPYAEVWLNGACVGHILEEGKVRLTGAEKKEKNLLELRLFSGNRNLFGPFRLREEPEYTGPYHYALSPDHPDYREGWLLKDLRIESAELICESQGKVTERE